MAALLIGSLLLFALAVTLMALYGRHRNEQMLHQERMAGLEKGVLAPAPLLPAPWSPRVYLLRGLIWSLAGVALIVFLLGMALSTEQHATAESMAYDAQHVARNLSIPVDQAMQIVEKDRVGRNYGTPASIALLGLIPLAVGLAYLVFYYTDPSRKLSEPRT
jgi:hypothetical protein